MGRGDKLFRLGPMLGGMNTSSEDGSLVTYVDPKATNPPPPECRIIENLVLTRRGALSVTKGYSQYRSIGGGVGRGIYIYNKAGASPEKLAMVNGGLYRFTSSSHTLISSGYSTTNYPSFATGMNEVIFCDGVLAPQRYNGTSVTTVGGSPPTAAVAGVFYQNRYWYFVANSSYVYYSDPSNINSGYSSNFVSCDLNDGQNVTAIGVFFIPGSLTPALLVGKGKSTGIITGSGTASDPYTFAKVNLDQGIPGFRQIQQFGNDIMHLTPVGVSTYKTSVDRVNLVNEYLSEKIRNIFTDDLDQSRLGDAHCWYDWTKSRVSYAFTETGFSYPNVIYHYDTRLGCWYRERWNVGSTCTAVVVDTDGTMYHLDDAGVVWVHDDSNSFAGQAFSWTFEFDYTDFGRSDVDKRVLEVNLTARGSGVSSFGLSCRLNYGANNGSTHTINLDKGQYVWGGGVWTSDPNVYQWGTNTAANKRVFPSGWFNNIKFTFTGTCDEQPVDIYDISAKVNYGLYR